MKFSLCRNTTYAHANHYGTRYGGYCLECSNAGVPEFVARIAELKREVAKLKRSIDFCSGSCRYEVVDTDTSR